jgi:nicotinate-nucleotide pyrophosphorylase (carboxylating)
MIPFTPDHALSARRLIELALAEDLGATGDRTSDSVIAPSQRAVADLIVRRDGVLAGMPVVEIVLEAFPKLSLMPAVRDGTSVPAKTLVASISGPLRSILTAERTCLNFLQRMSGIATMTARYVDAIRGTNAVVLDTRKTAPGWRWLDKYAVACGGGTNHRIGLFDGILIKDNHIAGLGPDGVAEAVRRARAHPANAGLPVEIEVDSLEQLAEVLPLRPEIVLLDNMPPATMAQAVALRNAKSPGTKLEASGGITLATIRAAAESGVDRISVGAITHSAPALDIALDYRS